MVRVCLNKSNMSEKHRALPSWMSKKAGKVKENEPLKTRRKRKAARSVFYCMNERELVEAAVSCLTNSSCQGAALRTDRKVEHKAEGMTVKGRENPASENTTTKPVSEVSVEESSNCGEDQETTYVSETDLDITEVEMLPYTGSPQHPRCEGQTSGAVQDQSAEKKDSQTQDNAAEDNDAFRLVREIFFT